jgi:hypothetical protein
MKHTPSPRLLAFCGALALSLGVSAAAIYRAPAPAPAAPQTGEPECTGVGPGDTVPDNAPCYVVLRAKATDDDGNETWSEPKVIRLLPPSCSLSGFVRDAAGEPIPGVTVAAVLNETGLWHSAVRTDAAGRYALPGVAWGTSYRIHPYDAPSFAPTHYYGVTCAESARSFDFVVPSLATPSPTPPPTPDPTPAPPSPTPTPAPTATPAPCKKHRWKAPPEWPC